MKLCRPAAIFLLLISTFKCYSQQCDSATNNIVQLPGKYYLEIDNKLTSADHRLTKKSGKYLQKLQRQENKLRQKFQQNDSTASDNLFLDAGKEYEQLSQQISGKIKVVNAGSGQYLPYLDSLGTSLKFLKQFGGANNKAAESLNSFHQLQDKLQQSEKIREFISQRKEQMKAALLRYTKLPADLKRQYNRINKTAYYYSAQVNEYKEMLKDPSRAERKALSLLVKLPAFQKFMKQNSQLALLFRTGDPSALQGAQAMALAGLQTRVSVQRVVQQQVRGGGPNAQQVIQQNLAQAKTELDKLKDKIIQLGGASSDVEMPVFKPNTQKTKSFLKRIEYGANVQFSKSTNQFSSATNIGLSFGYKLNDQSVLGVGMSYKMGMGTIRHIVISHEGLGLRSYGDYKIKGSLFVSGGYEMNHNAQFKNIEELRSVKAWQNSALAGVCKKYKINKKIKGEMRLLYDFLANSHIPVTQAVLFRVGYSF